MKKIKERQLEKRRFFMVKDSDTATQMIDDNQRVTIFGKTLSLLTTTHDVISETSKWFASKKVPFRTSDRDKGGGQVLRFDIPELKITKSYIENIINSMPSALLSLDRKIKIVLWNHKAEKLFGINASNAVDKQLDKVLPQMKPYLNEIRKTIETGEPSYFPKQANTTAKELRYEDITVHPLITDSIEGAVIRIDDITERVRMEEMIIQSEKMMSIGGLAAGMAHEINNPLAVIMQNVQVALRRIQGEIPASAKAAKNEGITMDQIRSFMEHQGITHILELIHETGVRTANIVQNMLNLSQKKLSGKVEQDIAVILDQTIELVKSDYDLKKQYDFKKIKIRKEYHPDTPLVLCEVSKIQQVFYNIFKNAAEAIQGSNQNEDPRFYLSVKRKDDQVRIEVADNGPGMPEDVRKQIFEPFFTTKPVGQGTGLGLSVSYFIITDNHNGKMSVISEQRKGSKFIIHLPIS